MGTCDVSHTGPARRPGPPYPASIQQRRLVSFSCDHKSSHGRGEHLADNIFNFETQAFPRRDIGGCLSLWKHARWKKQIPNFCSLFKHFHCLIVAGFSSRSCKEVFSQRCRSCTQACICWVVAFKTNFKRNVNNSTGSKKKNKFNMGEFGRKYFQKQRAMQVKLAQSVWLPCSLMSFHLYTISSPTDPIKPECPFWTSLWKRRTPRTTEEDGVTPGAKSLTQARESDNRLMKMSETSRLINSRGKSSPLNSSQGDPRRRPWINHSVFITCIPSHSLWQ